MTKKDYKLIADSIKQFRYKYGDMVGAEIDQQTISSLVDWLVHDLQNDNSKFDSERFFNACM